MLESCSPLSCECCKLDVPDSIEAIRDGLSAWHMLAGAECVLAPKPFAKGSSRTCYRGVYRASADCPWERMVFKRFSNEGTRDDRDSYCLEVEKSVVAECCAQQFNEAERPARRLEFLVPCMIRTDRGAHYNMEEVLPLSSDRQMTKFNDNKGIWVHSVFRPELGNFTEWVYRDSNEYILVADLQGVENNGRLKLTDPAILCSDATRFGSTNTGPTMMSRTVQSIPRRPAARL